MPPVRVNDTTGSITEFCIVIPLGLKLEPLIVSVNDRARTPVFKSSTKSLNSGIVLSGAYMVTFSGLSAVILVTGLIFVSLTANEEITRNVLEFIVARFGSDLMTFKSLSPSVICMMGLGALTNTSLTMVKFSPLSPMSVTCDGSKKSASTVSENERVKVPMPSMLKSKELSVGGVVSATNLDARSASVLTMGIALLPLTSSMVSAVSTRYVSLIFVARSGLALRSFKSSRGMKTSTSNPLVLFVMSLYSG